eukprot:TRINITY_DN77021_c0_g1_i1.p1 TRINITY_DN77021_c0_g1~~TRINITY_DN77021_c0_g1_i1.p1  ORF type:complete len:206 (+),score=35.80 TRINITY_DN77021_c0_g1_i1:22-618(+)
MAETETSKAQDAVASSELIPVFISASSLARIFNTVPPEVFEKCLMFFGSEPSWLFEEPKSSRPRPYCEFPAELDGLIIGMRDSGRLCLLKPAGWSPGSKCDFADASTFFEGHGFGALPLTYDQFEASWASPSTTESEDQLGRSRQRALARVRENYTQAVEGTGCYGHDYGPVIEMLRIADSRLFPILGPDGLEEFLRK